MDPCSGPMFSIIQWKWAASQKTMDLPNGDIHHHIITLCHTYFHHSPLMTTHHCTAVTCAGKIHAMCYNELFLKLNMVHISLYTHFTNVYVSQPGAAWVLANSTKRQGNGCVCVRPLKECYLWGERQSTYTRTSEPPFTQSLTVKLQNILIFQHFLTLLTHCIFWHIALIMQKF